ncbi:DUF6241 domain-containing protein [Neobacillus vireti]|uniref:Uncharacterized protein n=1 Tax=Neobacillus vireti LMG 21834 TaxID=1131730 RepID=A0AB94IQY4_9BACI|nr:DUF6241 domain-containing protein [Neobacillus vireti]ETI69413.1 hypothetical protein BAVI_07531 [Neobacillus vireti LMG 21834]KLT18894.1 hypothetical protein AA980_06020 [Neobacillus vireti]
MGKNKLALGIVFAILILGIGYYVSTSFMGAKEMEVKEPIEKNEKKDGKESVTTVADVMEDDEKIESQVEKEFPLGMTEAEIQKAIHSMSHSKVYAEQKWTHLEPTQERIDRLLDVLDRNHLDLNHRDLYISILERWKVGDFSKAVSDHNKIWNLQGGTVGKATRLLREEEEAEYRKENFE